MECRDKSSAVEMNQCIYDAYAAAQTQMDAAYRDLVARQTAAAADWSRISGKRSTVIERLRKAQRAWKKYRKLNCAYYAGEPDADGSAGATGNAICLFRLTMQRRDELQHQAEQLKEKGL